jgi:hypothetical protein
VIVGSADIHCFNTHTTRNTSHEHPGRTPRPANLASTASPWTIPGEDVAAHGNRGCRFPPHSTSHKPIHIAYVRQSRSSPTPGALTSNARLSYHGISHRGLEKSVSGDIAPKPWLPFVGLGPGGKALHLHVLRIGEIQGSNPCGSRTCFCSFCCFLHAFVE